MDPIDKNTKISLKVSSSEDEGNYTSILDFGVSTTYHNNVLELNIITNTKFLPFILLREVCYRFVPHEIKDPTVAKIFINQIVENNLQSLSVSKEWHDMFNPVWGLWGG